MEKSGTSSPDQEARRVNAPQITRVSFGRARTLAVRWLVFGGGGADTGCMGTSPAKLDRDDSRLRFEPTPAQAQAVRELLDTAPPAKRRATAPRS